MCRLVPGMPGLDFSSVSPQEGLTVDIGGFAASWALTWTGSDVDLEQAPTYVYVCKLSLIHISEPTRLALI
eukprot:2536172-Alexandrium_andersonii.AAC.1